MARKSSEQCAACTTVKCSVGLVHIEASPNGVTRANTLGPVGGNLPCKRHAEGEVSSVYCVCNSESDCPALTSLNSGVAWLKEYFKDASSASNLPRLDLKPAGSFSATVWQELARTRPGETLSYSELAARVGKRSAARAVGTAMRKNPVPLFVPCHRVVRSDGSLGNYSGGCGVTTKQWLLDHEAKEAPH